MNKLFHVVVVGAGIVGLIAAKLLAGRCSSEQLRLTVIDAAPRPLFSQDEDIGLRVSAIAPGSACLLQSVGAWERIVSTRVCAYREMRVWDAAGQVDGPESLHFEAAEFAVPELGHIVENTLIQAALLEDLRADGCELRFDCRIRNLELDDRRYRMQLESGGGLTADLVVGADGAGSLVRRQAGIGVRRWPYPQKAFVTHLRPELDHRNTAWQRFIAAGPVALLPLADGRVSTVWSTSEESAKQAMDASDKELGEMLTAATDQVLGVLHPEGSRGAFPLQAQHADRYVLPGLALIGDAAHSVHPLAGQGANLGIADAATLAAAIGSALDMHEHPGDLPVLRRYERARRAANRAMLQFTDGINRLFSNNAPLLARLRGTGMALFNRSGPVRRRAVRTALGVDTPNRDYGFTNSV